MTATEGSPECGYCIAQIYGLSPKPDLPVTNSCPLGSDLIRLIPELIELIADLNEL